MNRENIKAFIGKSKKGIVLIVAAALLSQLLNIAQYVYTRHTVREQTEKKTVNNLREVQRVVNLKTTVETAVQNAMGDVLANINEPDNFYSIVTRLESLIRTGCGTEKLLAKMAETIENYRGSEPQTDDVTMMVIKMTRME